MTTDVERLLPRIPVSPTASQAVLQTLRHGLLDGTLPPGSQVIQERIALQLGVSIVPLREALNTLVSEGLILYRPHRGYFVPELGLAELKEINAIRDSLETLAIKRSIPKLTEHDFASLAHYLEAMRVAADKQDLLEHIRADRTFHMTLFERCELPRLLQMITTLWDQCDYYRMAYLRKREFMDAHQHEHAEMLVLAQEREVGALLRLLRHHRGHLIEGVTSDLAD